MDNQFAALARSIGTYFKAYGGWKAVFTSPIFWLSLIVTMISYHRWVDENWVELTLALIPSLLGFSLGTYSILFSIITARMRRTMSELRNEAGHTYLSIVNATFFHFIFVQLLAMLWAIAFESHAGTDVAMLVDPDLVTDLFPTIRVIGSFIGFFLLIYSFALTLAAALAVYGLATLRTPDGD